uniref:Geminin coiled-coil domain containing n=1 Tax=Neolamprologus brichardi TaxID=32507 RepID=A0A3Q4GEQ6_NEOBR
MLQALALGPDTVDCSMETLASVWGHDPIDLSDLGEQRDESSPEWVNRNTFQKNRSMCATEPLQFIYSCPYNLHCCDVFQLQDTLLQREEELARLQEENNKLRAFLNSSFVRNLEQKAKVRAASSEINQQSKQRHSDLHLLKTSACSEPNLDLWVLRTLGLKDRDTIDTSEESSSEWSLRSLVYDTAQHMKPAVDTIQFNPPAERVFPPPVLPSGADQPRSSASGFIPTSPCHPPAAPHTPRNRTDLAFSMSLSPSSSVKTHSFPQGQAFVRKDVEGRWNFTWVPRQEP